MLRQAGIKSEKEFREILKVSSNHLRKLTNPNALPENLSSTESQAVLVLQYLIYF